MVEEKNVSCCYAKSDKYWVKDPAGIAWESFRSLGTVPFYGGENACGDAKTGCCATEGASRPKAACCS